MNVHTRLTALLCATALAVSCTEADVTEPIAEESEVLVTTIPSPETLEDARCSVRDVDGAVVANDFPAGDRFAIDPGWYIPACDAVGYQHTIGTEFYVAPAEHKVVAVALVSESEPAATTAQIGVHTNVPARVDSIVRIEADNGRMRLSVESRSTPTVYSVESGFMYVIWVSADGYHSASGAAFPEAGEFEAVTIQLVPEDEVVTTAHVAVNANVTAQIDSVIKVGADGTRARVAVDTRTTPAVYTVEADTSAYVFWASAPGYLPASGIAFPEPGGFESVQIELDELSEAFPTTADYLIASIPEAGMRAQIFSIERDGSKEVITTVTTNTVVTLDPGFIQVVCTDPNNQFRDVSVFDVVHAGIDDVVICPMQDVHAPEPPAAAPVAELSVSSHNIAFGDAVTLTVSSRNADNGVLAPLNIMTLGGSFTDEPFSTTTYCYTAFGPGGSDTDCETVSVDVPQPGLVLDSVTIFFADPWVTVQHPVTGLGEYQLPEHAGLPVEVVVWAEYSGDMTYQKDEVFGLEVGHSLVQPEDTPGCQVIHDQPQYVGKLWIKVGLVDFPGGIIEPVTAYHGSHSRFNGCYSPVDKFTGPNSVHFYAIQFKFWRRDL